MQWKHCGSPTSKKVWVQPSAGKMMAIVFWDLGGILPMGYMPQKTVVTRDAYATLLQRHSRENSDGR